MRGICALFYSVKRGFQKISGARFPGRVGAGAVWMGGGDACVALVGTSDKPPPRRGGSGVDGWWGRLRRPGGDIRQPPRVGAGAVWMGGGDACVALVGIPHKALPPYSVGIK